MEDYNIMEEKNRSKGPVSVLPMAAAALAMLLLILAMLLTVFWAVIYGDSKYRFYEKEYEKYRVTESLGMKLEDVMEVTDHMMAYLIGEEEELSIVTDVDGQTQDFFNEQDRLHMADVRNLFLGGLKLRNLCAAAAVLLIAGLIAAKTDWKRLLPRAYFWAVGILLVAAALLAAAFSVDFTRCFTIFHEIFFTNDLWMFNPSEDYMIRMLPEGFFFDMTVRIGLTFVGVLLGGGMIMAVFAKIIKWNNGKICGTMLPVHRRL